MCSMVFNSCAFRCFSFGSTNDNKKLSNITKLSDLSGRHQNQLCIWHRSIERQCDSIFRSTNRRLSSVDPENCNQFHVLRKTHDCQIKPNQCQWMVCSVFGSLPTTAFSASTRTTINKYISFIYN